MISIRSTTAEDIEQICSLDFIAQQDEERRDFITRSIANDCCHIAVIDEKIIGYGVIEHSFFEQGFISMLYVHPAHRRHGIGMNLMKHLQSLCRTPKLFTSTNLSNVPMQSLLIRLNYTLSGVIHNLDEDDPELIYFKWRE